MNGKRRKPLRERKTVQPELIVPEQSFSQMRNGNMGNGGIGTIGEGNETELLSPHRRDSGNLLCSVRGKWALPQSAYEDVANRMLDIVANGADRYAIRAASVLLAMHAQNGGAENSPQAGVTINVASIGTLDEGTLSTLRAARRIASCAIRDGA